MAIDVCVLASGSSGNCTAVRTPGGVMLIDLGIGPRIAAARLAGTGVGVDDVSAVCLTHLDHDHFNRNWVSTLLRNRVRVFCHASCVDDLVRRAGDLGPRLAEQIYWFEADPFEPLPGLEAHPLPLAHDREGSHGYVLQGFGCRVGYATDLGRVPDELVERFEDLDLLALESNYDPQMQLASGRPPFLQRRITGGQGHLSNQQAFEAIKRIVTRDQARHGRLPERIVLLHRSRQCNCPDLLRELFSRDVRLAPRLVLAEQDGRSEWLRASRTPPYVGAQLAMAWG